MTELETLLAIEEIKKVKARYFYGLDHKNWELWRRAVFAPNATLEVPEIPIRVEGRDRIIAWVAERTADQESVHHGHTPIIEITSESSASAIWAMEDRLYRPMGTPFANGRTYLHGFGHYHETYARTLEGWRITSTRLARLRVESTFVT